MNWEIEIVRWLNSWIGVNYFYDWAILFRATYLWYLMMLALGAFLIFSVLPEKLLSQKLLNNKSNNFQLFIHAVFASVVARFVLTEIIRFFWSRPRPFEILYGLNSVLSHSLGGSFPSGHASAAFAIAMVVSYYYSKTGILFFLAAISIGLGRIATGLHWPTDIFGGVVVGIFSAWLIGWLFKKAQTNKN